MNWLDIAIIVVVVIATFLGLRIGIIKAVLFLAGIIVGVILAGHYYVPLSERLTFIPQASIAKIVVFAVILVGVMLIAGVLARLLRWVVSVVMLGWVNHLGGAIFGLALGAIFCSVLLATWVKFFGSGLVTEAFLARMLLDKFPLILGLLPSEFDVVRSFFQ